jgi:hypothetical protein
VARPGTGMDRQKIMAIILAILMLGSVLSYGVSFL